MTLTITYTRKGGRIALVKQIEIEGKLSAIKIPNTLIPQYFLVSTFEGP